MIQLPPLSSPVRRRRAIIHDGTAIDLATVAPKTAVAWWTSQFSVLQTDSSVKTEKRSAVHLLERAQAPAPCKKARVLVLLAKAQGQAGV